MEVCNQGIRGSGLEKAKTENIGTALFYTALIMDIVIVILDKSDYIIQYEGRYFQITFLLFGLKVLMTRYTYKEWGLMFGFGLLGLVSYLATGRNEILRLVMMIAASKNISLRSVMECTYFITLVGVGLLILLSVTGIYGRLFVEADFRGTGIERRYCLGLGHPNALHCMIWAIMVLVLYLYLDRMRWYHFLLLLGINWGFYLLTDSRTGVLMGIATILMGLGLRYQKSLRSGKAVYVAGIAAVLGSVLFSVLVAAKGTSIPFFKWLDQYVTGRILWSHHYEPLSSWTLFADPFRGIYMDMGYIRLFDWYGYIPGIVYTAVVCILIWYCYRKQKYAEFLVIMAFTLYTVFEAHAVSVYLTRNYLLMLLLGTWNVVFGVNGTREKYLWRLLPLSGK